MTYKSAPFGLTVVELLVTISVISIIAVAGAPGIRNTIRQHRLTDQITAFVSALQLAQSEAIGRAKPVVVCASGNAESATAACGGGNIHWSDGWIVFVDPDNDGILDAGETIVRVSGPLTTGLQLNGSSGLGNAVTFDATGSLSIGGLLVLCDSSDFHYSRAVMLGSNGRIRLAPMDGNGIPVDDGGSEITTCTP